MLNQYLIEQISLEEKIAPLNIIREYLEMEVLYYLSQTKLSENMIFYGGTALRLGWQSFRFSEDLDFLLRRPFKNAQKNLTKALQMVVQNNSDVSLEEVLEKHWTIFGLLHIRHALLKHPIRIKIEISKKKNGIKYENILISSLTSNKEVIFPTASLESLYELKKRTLQKRDLPRDWFDYWYLNQKLYKHEIIKMKFPFSKKEFSRELKRWLPQDKWKIIETVLKFYSHDKN